MHLRVLITCLLFLAPDLKASEAQSGERTTLLFAGSSSMYWNDLPREVAKLVDGKITGHLGGTVIPEAVGRSGSDIRVYLEPGFSRYEYGVKPGQTFLSKLADEKPDIVPLMVVCRFIMGDDPPKEGQPDHALAVTKYCEAVRASGGEPMFYEMGWGKDEKHEAGRKRILELALKNKIRLFAPCSSAWARVHAEKPGLALQHPQDNSHPGDAGHFLNLACFYAALTGDSPVGRLPRTFHVWPHGKYEADEAKLASFKPDAYQAKMAKWMFKHMATDATATLDEDTARYLETTAWETWQRVQRLLAAGG
ncbi:hypothetical protein [Prosthecobacter sp.]|uniref:hypothetical protein n=1 Tax=Prosthecobacter sp. TaxID=1965333 RepID=UPI003784A4C2